MKYVMNARKVHDNRLCAYGLLCASCIIPRNKFKLIKGPAKATKWLTAEEIEAKGYIGLYKTDPPS